MFRVLLLSTLILLGSQNVLAQFSRLGIDSVEFQGGTGEATDNLRLALHWDLSLPKWRLGSWDVHGSLALNHSMLDGDRSSDQSIKLKDTGLTPILTFYPNGIGSRSFQPYIDMGIGIHYLTDKRLGGEKVFSTRMQFGDHLGVGALIGPRRDMRIAYQFQHFSNGGIESPNPGINFHLLVFGFKTQLLEKPFKRSF